MYIYIYTYWVFEESSFGASCGAPMSWDTVAATGGVDSSALWPSQAGVQPGFTLSLSLSVCRSVCIYIYIFKSLRLRPPTPEAYGKTADFGTLCIPGSSQRLDPSAALLSSSDRSRLAALNVMLTPCPVP